MSTGFFNTDNVLNDRIYNVELKKKEIILPANKGAISYRLTSNDSVVFMSWLEPYNDVKPTLNGSSSQLKWASWDGQSWSPPDIVAQSSHMFSNFADRPSVVINKQGEKYAHWLKKTSDKRFSYDVQIIRSSSSDNKMWKPLGTIWTESTQARMGYDGFVSMVPTEKGVQAFWIDGRLYDEKNGGPMRLVTAHITEKINQEYVLDNDICSCCDTSAVNTSDGVIVFYRGRTIDEIRDIMSVRQTADGWSNPKPVSKDNWRIAGCAVNGPKAAANKENLILTWYTGATGKPSVRAAYSTDAGRTFSKGIDIDTFSATGPVGKVDVVLLDNNEAIVSWVGRSENGAVILLRRIGFDGTLGPIVKIADIKEDRRVGFPQMERINKSVFLAWGVPSKENNIQGIHEKVLGIKMVELEIKDIPDIVRKKFLFSIFSAQNTNRF